MTEEQRKEAEKLDFPVMKKMIEAKTFSKISNYFEKAVHRIPPMQTTEPIQARIICFRSETSRKK